MKIGIFGGTFNPPHKGHTRMIEKMAEELELDKVLIIPNKIPPIILIFFILYLQKYIKRITNKMKNVKKN